LNKEQETNREPLLSVRDITKSFGGVTALASVSVDVFPGDVVGIIGPNGSGKTTLVNTITGFVKSDAGKVVFKSKDITNWEPHRISDMGLSRTFQVMRPYYSLPALSYPFSLLGRGEPAAGEAVEKWGVETRWLWTYWKRSVLKEIRMCLIKWRLRSQRDI
jgi:ABC-type branched-subunit amino acid transport system ATPase component